MVAVILSLPVAWDIFAMTENDLFFRYQVFTLALQAILCFFVFGMIINQKDVVIGRNLKSILFGIGLLVAMQGINFSQFLLRDLPFAVFSFTAQFIYFAALIIFTWGLWDYDPVRPLDLEHRRQLSRIDQNLRRVLRSLLFSR